MPQTIRLRNIVREEVLEMGPDEPVLRVPYDLFHPDGSARLSGELAEWLEGGVVRTGRVAPAKLGDTVPGERVLLRGAPGAADDSRKGASDDEWWLFEIELVRDATTA